jgi:hypothetical protein
MVYEAIQKKKGKFSLMDASKIEMEINDKYLRLSRKKTVSAEKEKE